MNPVFASGSQWWNAAKCIFLSTVPQFTFGAARVFSYNVIYLLYMKAQRGMKEEQKSGNAFFACESFDGGKRNEVK